LGETLFPARLHPDYTFRNTSNTGTSHRVGGVCLVVTNGSMLVCIILPDYQGASAGSQSDSLNTVGRPGFNAPSLREGGTTLGAPTSGRLRREAPFTILPMGLLLNEVQQGRLPAASRPEVGAPRMSRTPPSVASWLKYLGNHEFFFVSGFAGLGLRSRLRSSGSTLVSIK